MKSRKSNHSGFAVIELLLIIGILLIVLRLVYAHKIFEWENDIVRSFGIDPIMYRLMIGVGLVCFVVAIAAHRRIRAKKDKQKK